MAHVPKLIADTSQPVCPKLRYSIFVSSLNSPFDKSQLSHHPLRAITGEMPGPAVRIPGPGPDTRRGSLEASDSLSHNIALAQDRPRGSDPSPYGRDLRPLPGCREITPQRRPPAPTLERNRHERCENTRAQERKPS